MYSRYRYYGIYSSSRYCIDRYYSSIYPYVLYVLMLAVSPGFSSSLRSDTEEEDTEKLYLLSHMTLNLNLQRMLNQIYDT